MDIRVCHVVESLDNTYGGPARSIPSLCVPLQRMNVDNSIHSVDSAIGSSNEIVEQNGLSWNRYEPAGLKVVRYSKGLASLRDFCERKNVDIVHLHSLWTYPSYVALRVAKDLGLPLVLSARSNLYQASLKRSSFRKSVVRKLFVEDLLRNVACIHATSEEEAAEIELLKLGCRIAVVGNGVSVEEFDNLPAKLDARSQFSLPEDAFVLLFFSRVHPRKGLHRLVNVWSSLSKEYPNLSVVVAGPNEDSSYFSEVMAEVKKNRLESRFRYLGMVGGKDRLAVMAAADVFVLPTDFENFGMSIAEALAARLPVITTHGTPWRALEEVDAGWWIDSSESSLAEAIKAAVASKDKLCRMGLNGRRLVEDHYGWGAAAKEMRDVYEEILRS